jgi:hypothetical protein
MSGRLPETRKQSADVSFGTSSVRGIPAMYMRIAKTLWIKAIPATIPPCRTV